MNEISLIYYGAVGAVEKHLLFLLNCLDVLPEAGALKGFYLRDRRFGQETLKPVAFGAADGGDVIVIYRYLSEVDLQALAALNNRRKGKVRFYLLLHKHFDIEYALQVVEPLLNSSELIYVVDLPEDSVVRSFNQVRRQLGARNTVRLIPRKGEKNNSQPSAQARLQLPVFVLFLLKIFVNPVDELKRYSILLKYTNLRFLTRLLELIFFIEFCVRAVVLTGFFLAVRGFGYLRVGLIKLGFLVRHVLLMCGFKSFGVLVDTYYVLERSRVVFIKVGFMVRHAFLMAAYRIYGIGYDVLMLLERLLIHTYNFIRYILIYPLRKAWWFTSFQYNKRVKKYFDET